MFHRVTAQAPTFNNERTPPAVDSQPAQFLGKSPAPHRLHQISLTQPTSEAPIQRVKSEKVARYSNLPGLKFSLYARYLKQDDRKQYDALKKEYSEKHDAVPEDDRRFKAHEDLNKELSFKLAEIAKQGDFHTKLKEKHGATGTGVGNLGTSGLNPEFASHVADLAEMRKEQIGFRDAGELNSLHLKAGMVPKGMHIHSKSQNPDDPEVPYTGLLLAHHDLAKPPPQGRNDPEDKTGWQAGVEKEWHASHKSGFASTATLGELLGRTGRPDPDEGNDEAKRFERQHHSMRAPFDERFPEHAETIHREMSSFVEDLKDRERQKHGESFDADAFDQGIEKLHDKRVFIDPSSGRPIAGDNDLLTAGTSYATPEQNQELYGKGWQKMHDAYKGPPGGSDWHGLHGAIRRGTMGTMLDLNVAGKMAIPNLQGELVKHGMEPHNPNPEPLESGTLFNREYPRGQHLTGDRHELHAAILDSSDVPGAEYGPGWMHQGLAGHGVQVEGIEVPRKAEWQESHAIAEAPSVIDQYAERRKPTKLTPTPPLSEPPLKSVELQKKLDQIEKKSSSEIAATRAAAALISGGGSEFTPAPPSTHRPSRLSQPRRATARTPGKFASRLRHQVLSFHDPG